MADKTEVTVLKQKVFHDGLSMVVLTPGEGKVAPEFLAGLYADGVIADPGKEALKGAAAPTGFSDGGESASEVETLRRRVAELEAERDDLLAELDEADAKIAKLSPPDNDGDGNPGGSNSQTPPALTGKTKAELLEIATAEKVTVKDGATNADIIEAIEAARAVADDAPPA